MFGSTIKKRVLEVINAKIDIAEADYKQGVADIEQKAEDEKNELVDKLVEGLIGKII